MSLDQACHPRCSSRNLPDLMVRSILSARFRVSITSDRGNRSPDETDVGPDVRSASLRMELRLRERQVRC
jgi:hypothetical protein